MKKNKKGEKTVPAGMFMMLAEDAKAVNIYAGMGIAGQQLLLERFAKADSLEDKRRIIEELTK